MAQRAAVDLNMPSTDCVALAVANQIGSGRLFTTRISRKSDPCGRSVSLKRARGQIGSVARELCVWGSNTADGGWGGWEAGRCGGMRGVQGSILCVCLLLISSCARLKRISTSWAGGTSWLVGVTTYRLVKNRITLCQFLDPFRPKD